MDPLKWWVANMTGPLIYAVNLIDSDNPVQKVVMMGPQGPATSIVSGTINGGTIMSSGTAGVRIEMPGVSATNYIPLAGWAGDMAGAGQPWTEPYDGYFLIKHKGTSRGIAAILLWNNRVTV